MPELAIQRYLRSGKTLEDLAREFSIKASAVPELGIVALNYHQFLTPMEEPLARECRALYLEDRTWEIVSRSFEKFHNYGEPLAAELDWSTAEVLEKLDGTLVCLYHWRGAWRAGTRSRPDARGNVADQGLTFAELVLRALADMGETWESFTATLDPALYYSFELTAPENRVMVFYGERRLTWLAAWEASTLREADIWALPDLPAPRVRAHSIAALDDLLAWLEGLSPFENEGVVVRDGAGSRLKLKCPQYVLAVRAVTQLSTDRARLELLLSGSVDDHWPLLPEFFREKLTELRADLDRLARETQAHYQQLQHIPEQRDFAFAALQHPWSNALFELRKGKAMDEIVAKARPETLLKLLGLKDEPAPDPAAD